MSVLFSKFILTIVEHLADKPNSYWNIKWCWRVSQAVGPELKMRNYSKRKLFWTLKCEIQGLFYRQNYDKDLADGTVQKQ